MRVLRIGKPRSVIGQDVHAALVSWGHGSSVVGGIALIGVRAPGCDDPVDAVIILPHGVLVVVGVDLPDPAKELHAPIDGPWTADGWPLEREGSLNPAAPALSTAGSAVRALQDTLGTPLAACAVIAVGPYVGKVVQAPQDTARGIRVVYPEPSAIRAVTRTLHGEKFHLDRVQHVVRQFEADLPLLSTALLHEEGFADAVTPEQALATTQLMAPATDAAPSPAHPARSSQPARSPKPARSSPAAGAPVGMSARKPRWLLPAGAAAAVLAVLAVVVIVVSTGGSEESTAQPSPAPVSTQGVDFRPRGTDRPGTCSSAAYGDVRSWLMNEPCNAMTRALYESTVDGQGYAISVVSVQFAQPAVAQQFKKQVDEPGSGGLNPLRANKDWPGAPQSFDNATYRSSLTDATVRVAMVVPVTGEHNPNDPRAVAVATKALQLPAS